MNSKDKKVLRKYFISILRIRREDLNKYPDGGNFLGNAVRQTYRDVLQCAKFSCLIEDYDLGKNTVTIFGEEVTENDRV